jgi:hypothetical protein
MTLRKRCFDKKFSREFFVKAPFFIGCKSMISPALWLSVPYRKQFKIAKIRVKEDLLAKIAATRAENDHYI